MQERRVRYRFPCNRRNGYASRKVRYYYYVPELVMTDNDFQVWMPLEPLSKGIADGHARPIQGFATTDDLDLQQEVIVQNGIDVGPLLEKGFIDWDHKGNLGPQYIIGEPVSCE